MGFAFGLKEISVDDNEHSQYSISQKLKEVITESINFLVTNKKARDFKRFFLGSATEGELDKQGRVLISSSLRAYADLEKEVVLAGVLDKVEIWSKEAWEARTADVEENIEDIASDMEDLGLSI